MLSVSKYNIYTKLNSEEYLLIHGYTGSVDVVSKDIYLTLKDVEKSLNFGAFDFDDLEVLIERGYVTDKTWEEEKNELKKISKKIKNVEQKTVFPYLMPTYNCNFRCTYCYEKDLLKNGKEWMNKTIDINIVDAFFNRINKLRYNGAKIENMCLFGGEPLLKENLNIIEYIVKKSIENNIGIIAITNGYDVEYFKDVLGNDKIKHVQITIDGSEHVHNKKRFLEGRKATFSKIMDNIDLCLDMGVEVDLRSNIDAGNVEELEKLKQLFEQQGWADNKLFKSYTNVLISKYSTCVDEISEATILRKIEKDKTFRESENIFLNIYSRFSRVFKGEDEFIDFRPEYCGAVSKIFILDPYGDVYSCTHVVGTKENVIGSVDSNGNLNLNANYNKWSNRTVDNIEECSKCPYALICGGGCAANALKVSGNIYKKYCEGFKEKFNEILPFVYERITSKIKV